MRRLFYFAPTFYPKSTGFAIAFTNIIKAIVEKEYFEEILVFSTDADVEAPEGLEAKCKLLTYRLKGRERLAKAPRWMCEIGLRLVGREVLAKVRAHQPRAEDVFFYEEFGVGFEKYIMNSKYPQCRHYLRVHGTFPEFTNSYESLFHRRRYVELATAADENHIVSTTNFYFEYLNTYFFDNSYDVQQRINYYMLPNLISDSDSDSDSDSAGVDCGEKITLIQLGRMDELGVFQKGFADTVRALQYIESQNPSIASSLRLVLIGGGAHESKVDTLLGKLEHVEVIRRKRCSNREVKEFLAASQIVLMPSRCEGMSMFATEALFLGKPIVFTKNNGLQDYLRDGMNGMAVTPFDYTEIAKAIIAYVETPRLIQIHSENCKQTASDILRKTSACIDVLFK